MFGVFFLNQQDYPGRPAGTHPKSFRFISHVHPGKTWYAIEVVGLLHQADPLDLLQIVFPGARARCVLLMQGATLATCHCIIASHDTGRCLTKLSPNPIRHRQDSSGPFFLIMNILSNADKNATLAPAIVYKS